MPVDAIRIPHQFEKFVPYLKLTDNYQLADDPDNPGTPRFEKWQWSAAESTKWTDFRTRADALFIDFDADNFVNKNVRDKIKTLMREVNEYDHDRDTGHKLLDKVAMYGNIDDCNIFRVKRGTVLADDTSTPSPDLGTAKPALFIRENSAGEHKLEVTHPGTPDSVALPDAVMACIVYRCVKEAGVTPANIEEYFNVGTSKRGLFLYTFSGMTFDPAKKYFIWYIGRYLGKNGKFGEPSVAVKAMVME